MTLIVRPATLDDVRQYYPDVGASFRAWVAEIDGVVDGIVGVVMTRPVACLISCVGERLRPLLKTLSVLRAIKRVHDLCRAYHGRIIAVQDKNEPQSPAILARLGFYPIGLIDGDLWHEFGR